MRLHYIQHVSFEGLGYIETWAHARELSISSSALYAGDTLPEPDDYDLLVVMGGPMGVSDTGIYPWLVSEKACIRAAIDAGKKVLGVCLGAQLIAEVLGAKVYPGSRKEIGWFPVTKTEAGEEAEVFSNLPASFEAFHWHGDTFDLPDGAVHLARSAVCEQQAFLYDDRVLALQFHLESTPSSVAALIENCADELPGAASKEDMLQKGSCFDRLNAAMTSILDSWAKRTGGNR